MKVCWQYICGMVLVLHSGLAWVETAVVSDSQVEWAIRNQLDKPAGELTEEDLGKVTVLDLGGFGLPAISLPAGLTGLNKLILWGNELTELTLPGDLSRLTDLVLWGNRLTKLSIPEGLTRLEVLRLWGNQLTELTLPTGLSQ